MNCRIHEHRHFERTLRSLDTVPGPFLAEGRFYFQDCPVLNVALSLVQMLCVRCVYLERLDQIGGSLFFDTLEKSVLLKQMFKMNEPRS